LPLRSARLGGGPEGLLLLLLLRRRTLLLLLLLLQQTLLLRRTLLRRTLLVLLQLLQLLLQLLRLQPLLLRAALLLLLENAEGQTVDAQLEMAVNLARDAGLHLGEHVGGLLMLVPGGDRHQVLADRPAVVKVWRAVDLLLVDLPAVHKDTLHAGGLRIREVDGVAPAID